jgi:hypothetical protein
MAGVMATTAKVASRSAAAGQAVGCEVKVGDTWLPVSLSQAHRIYGMAAMRCFACHGPVVVFGVYTKNHRLSLTHRKAHHGCPLLPSLFTGAPTPHPSAVT